VSGEGKRTGTENRKAGKEILIVCVRASNERQYVISIKSIDNFLRNQIRMGRDERGIRIHISLECVKICFGFSRVRRKIKKIIKNERNKG
jgi:hypothetical protein